uniref:Carboxymuconolactone decarboxylase family protein n=2 Tax=Thermorudis TaxID=1649508 RepID=A0A7C2W9R9_9BACT
MALELAERVTATPTAVNDELFERLRRHFTEAQIVELAAICAWENYRARFNRVLDIEPHGFYQVGDPSRGEGGHST